MPYMLNGVPLVYGQPFVVGDIQHPANVLDLWTRAELEAIGLVWFDPPAPPFETQRTLALIAVDAKRDSVFAAGFLVTGGPLTELHLQLRNADDKANWLIVENRSRQIIAADEEMADVAMIPIRTMENQTVVLTPNEVLSVLSALETWGSEVMARAWSLKDEIAAAPDQYELNQILTALNAGWP